MKRALTILFALASSGTIGDASAGDRSPGIDAPVEATIDEAPATSRSNDRPRIVDFPDAEATPESIGLRVSVEHGDVVRLSGDGLVALRTDHATSVAEKWAAIQIDAPTAGDRDGELPPLSWELVQRRSGASRPSSRAASFV